MSVTLRDVAELAGVSPATASRALDPTASASAGTRDRVAEAARRLGYVGNTAARSLRTSRSDTIGLLIPDVRNPFFTDLAYAVEKSAARSGLTVMIALAVVIGPGGPDLSGPAHRSRGIRAELRA